MRQSEGFAVPFGETFGDRRLVAPEEASKSAAYECPACETLLVLKHGTKRSAHFAHRHNPHCNRETVEHITAKRRIRDLALAQGSPFTPALDASCQGDGVRPCRQRIPLQVSIPFDSMELEATIGGFIADVAFYHQGEPTFAFEVYVSHRVTDTKWRSYACKYGELDASEVLNPKNASWLLLSHNFALEPCQHCQAEIRLREAWEERLKKEAAARANRRANYREVVMGSYEPTPAADGLLIRYKCRRCGNVSKFRHGRQAVQCPHCRANGINLYLA